SSDLGVVNENDLTYLGGWHSDLQEIFGINPIETDTLYPKDKNYVSYQNESFQLQDYATIIDMKGAKVEGMYIEDFYAYTPAVTSHSYTDGKALYVAARLDKTFHEAFYKTLIEDFDLEGDLAVKSGIYVSIQVRGGNE